MDVVGDCIYDGELLSIAYILNVGDGEVICLCEHMHCSRVICSCIHD
jgi:hypothetical protein